MCNPNHRRHAKKNNKGSAIITVVVAMLFVMALGAALLFASYTGYSIEITQRNDKESLYDASSAMDDVRLGVQTLLSESIASAYTSVLSTYITDSENNPSYNPQTAFNNAITAQLFSKKTARNALYFTSNTRYSAAAIVAFINTGDTTVTVTNAGFPAETASFKDAHGATVTVTGSTLSLNPTTSAITIKALSVKCVSGGFESNITSDITIAMPYFYASSSTTSSINNYAIIANSKVECASNDRTVTGRVFAGDGVTISGSGSSLKLLDGDLISKGPISVGDNSSLNFDASANELWASEITVGKFCETTLDGKVYVADDLVLNGGNSTVTLKNTYFGFGNDISSPAKSSSIMVNGRGDTPSTLDISGLNKLSLAGISFINFTDDSLNVTPIPMGESMSVKSDQLAYLVPASCISYASNPYIFASNETAAAPTIDTSTVLWSVNGTNRTLSDYIGTKISDNTYSKCKIQTLFKNPDANTKIAYVFFVFNDKKYANAYFQHYFESDSSKISQYLNLYMSLKGEKVATTDTAGNTFYTTSGGELSLNPASDTVWANGAQTKYNSMKSPYETFVNADKLAKLSTTAAPLQFKNKDKDKDVVAIVAKADYTYDSNSPSTVRLIIASHNVTISKAFTGIVIAGGSVTVKNNVTSGNLTSDVLNSTWTDGITTYKLSDFLLNSAQLGGASDEKVDLWNLDALVSYENWTKK